jgi:hypothetical protein
MSGEEQTDIPPRTRVPDEAIDDLIENPDEFGINSDDPEHKPEVDKEILPDEPPSKN